MKKIDNIMVLCIAVAVTLAGCCRQKTDLPAEPDYADSANWYVVDRSADVDIFYIVSTETDDYIQGGVVQHFADITNDSLRELLHGEMVGVDHLLSGDLNFYSPYYRQCTMKTFAKDSLMAERLPVAMEDVRRAFKNYIEQWNGGRPFILAGFSQGAIGVVELLKEMDDEAYNRMAAAYVIGWKITDFDLAATTHIRPALDSTELGVTICYNSVRTPDSEVPLLSRGNRIAINPVNWRTDATPALLPDILSDDTFTVTLDTVSLLLLVDGYNRGDYMLPLIGREGNYHCLEISLYREPLRRNIALRASKAVEKKNQQ